MQEGTINRVFRTTFPEAEHSRFRTNAWAFGVPQRPHELTPLHATVLHALATAAKLEEHIGVTLLPDREGGEVQRRSYRELYHVATRMAGALAARGVTQGDRVLIVLPTSLEFLECFFAIQMLRAIPVPTYPPVGLRMKAGLEKLGNIANHAGTRLCVTNARLKPLMGELLLRAAVVEELVLTEELATGEPPVDKARAMSGDAAFIQYTSGSTGDPKGVLLSHKNLVSNIHAAGQAFKINKTDVMVSWLPLYHDMGLIGGLLTPIYWRIPLVLMSPTSFLSKPSRWLRAISDYKGTLSPAPNFAYGLCATRVPEQERSGLDLSRWRWAMNGAEPVNYRTLVDFEKLYKPYGFDMKSLYPVYGLAESSLAVTFPRSGQGVKYEVVDRQELANGRAVLASGQGSMAVVSVGRAVPGHFVAVVAPDGTSLPEREVGHIVVHGPSVMEGYYNAPEATAAVLQDGWLWTGDLGYFADENLYVTGRVKDLIIIRGRNIYAEDVERVAERIDGVRQGGVVAFGISAPGQDAERVVVVAETKVSEKANRDEIGKRIAERVLEYCEVALDEVVLVDAGTIPKTSSGKRQRSQCRDLYLAEQLRPVKMGKLGLGVVLVRSQAGHLLNKAKGIFRRRGTSAAPRSGSGTLPPRAAATKPPPVDGRDPDDR
jgi:acyl-CoA synthetase (AMP-forming)/AMP-acid ligase II